jgi:hypothetical protein
MAEPDMDTIPPRPEAETASHELFIAAGVQPGDSAEWSISGWPMLKETIVTQITIKGIHHKNGKPAIEVIDQTGHGFRAYPKELRKLEPH